MANFSDPDGGMGSLSFSEFPEDVQLCILSLLTPSDICSFSCTSKHFVSLCHQDSKLWYSMCDRKWGSKTNINKWGDGKVNFKLLYKTLNEYENLIGFWRRSGGATSVNAGESRLVFFEWGSSCVTGSRVSPSKDGAGYGVIKTPFFRLSLSSRGQMINYLDPGCLVGLIEGSDLAEKYLLRVNVSFMGKGHVIIEESRGNGIWANYSGSPDARRGDKNGSFANLSVEEISGVVLESLAGSPPDRIMSEVYQYFANRTSPGAGGERAWRRQRRREKERQAKRRWEAEHFVKIVNCSPTPACPLQGLWKGIFDDLSLDFCLVTYDDVGGMVCRRIGDSTKPLSGSAPVFWTSDATFHEPPFSPEEEVLYSSRLHLGPLLETGSSIPGQFSSTESAVSRMMFINSSYDMILPGLAEVSANPRQAEGRIWLYKHGMFGFGFLRDNFVVDLKHIARDGCLLDAVNPLGG
ncbi:F-box protein-like protein [Drosera capensis]